MARDIAFPAAGRDDAWDRFVLATPGGSYVQTTAWAEIKASVGWDAARVVVRDGETPVGGCQVLLRSVGPVTLCYAPRGPVAAVGAAAIAALDALPELLAGRRIAYVKVQPPLGAQALEQELLNRRYARSDMEAAPVATTMVALRDEPEAILARMRSGTRANIRKAERRGVRIRLGSREEMSLFGELVEATSERQGFAPYPPGYYLRMLDLFADVSHGQLFFAEHEGQVVSGALIIGSGDTAVYKMGGWRGERSAVRPNELLHWTAMQWARERGYAFYDFDGLTLAIAERILRGEPLPDEKTGTWWFKLGFGGEVHIGPRAYDTSTSRLLAPAVRFTAPRMERWRDVAQRLVGRRT